MKRFLSMVLALVTAFSIAACGSGIAETSNGSEETSASATIEYGDAELNRAAGYGFIPKRFFADMRQEITYVDYNEMMVRMLDQLGNADMAMYEEYMGKMAALDEPMPKSDMMLDNYIAALAIGDVMMDVTTSWDYVYGKFGMENIDNLFCFSYHAWEDYGIGDRYENQDIYLLWNGIPRHNFGFTNNARDYGMFRNSPCSGNTLYFVDWTEDGSEFAEIATAEDAIRSAARLYETLEYSVRPVMRDESAAEDVAIRAAFEKRKEAILQSETDVAYTGKAYYVSADGSDKNNGLSEDKPWATVEKVNNSSKLRAGDVVFFRRGDTFYGQIFGHQGVTYSAYGTGAKPIISGALDRTLMDADKWSLFYEGDNGEKIWLFKGIKQQAGNMIFNGGESWAVKDYARYYKKKFYTITDATKPYDVTKELAFDLEFFTDGDAIGGDAEKLERKRKKVGNLYLRCDAGNPAEVFDRIECSSTAAAINPSPDIVLDNLSFQYFGLACHYPVNHSNIVFQNCECSYCGGFVGWFDDESFDGVGYPAVCGDGLTLGGEDNKALNCYVHDILDTGIHIEYDATYGKPYCNISAEGCAVERCGVGCAIMNYGANCADGLDITNITVNDNYFVDMNVPSWGYDTRHRFTVQYLGFYGGLCFNRALTDNVRITNNVFLNCFDSPALFCDVPEEKYQPYFSGNQFYTNPGEYVLLTRDFSTGAMWGLCQDNADELIPKYLENK